MRASLVPSLLQSPETGGRDKSSHLERQCGPVVRRYVLPRLNSSHTKTLEADGRIDWKFCRRPAVVRVGIKYARESPNSKCIANNNPKVHSSIATWKIFFLFFGSFSFVFAIVVAYFMPDTQANARWLNPRERKVAMERVRANQTVSTSDQWKWSQFWEALRDPQTIFFFVTAA